MAAIIGLVLGILATVLASRYYFLRSVDKSLSVFGLLNSYVFAGIAPDVRHNLHFIFQEQEVKDLQQVVLLVANDGERAISNVIEPLSVQLPAQIEVLDASVLHRNPDTLKATINHTAGLLEFSFPLLNKGEFFIVKMLLSGSVAMRDLTFSILADDLPRSLKVKQLPPASLRDSGYKVEWSLAAAGCVVLFFCVWVVYLLRSLWVKQPDRFPFPWGSYVFSWPSILLVGPAVPFLLLLGFISIAMITSAFFDGEFPPSRGPKFPLPKELRSIVFPYRFSLRESFIEDAPTKEASAPRKETS